MAASVRSPEDRAGSPTRCAPSLRPGGDSEGPVPSPDSPHPVSEAWPTDLGPWLLRWSPPPGPPQWPCSCRERPLIHTPVMDSDVRTRETPGHVTGARAVAILPPQLRDSCWDPCVSASPAPSSPLSHVDSNLTAGCVQSWAPGCPLTAAFTNVRVPTTHNTHGFAKRTQITAKHIENTKCRVGPTVCNK